jgi:MYXO-CTERM domain-containing protein
MFLVTASERAEMKTTILTLAIAGMAGSALAVPTYTTINAPAAGELSHSQVLGSIYATAPWTPSGLDFVGPGGQKAIRVADDGVASPISLVTGNANSGDDKAFDTLGGTGNVVAKAKFAGDLAMFGWLNGASGGGKPTFTGMLMTQNLGSSSAVPVSPAFRWGLDNLTTGGFYTSLQTENQKTGGGDYDMLVTYEVTGLPSGAKTWLLFWEDRIPDQAFADGDYNDAVIEISVVPAPGALALLGLGGLLAARRRR